MEVSEKKYRLFCKDIPAVADESAFPGIMVTISAQD